MPIANLALLSQLGSHLLYTPPKKGPLPTDGKGKVTGDFLDQLFVQDAQGFIFGDPQHNTLENAFNNATIAAMKRHGIAKVFFECTEGELLEIKKRAAEGKQDTYASMYTQLDRSNLVLLASDNRPKEWLAQQMEKLQAERKPLKQMMSVITLWTQPYMKGDQLGLSDDVIAEWVRGHRSDIDKTLRSMKAQDPTLAKTEDFKRWGSASQAKLHTQDVIWLYDKAHTAHEKSVRAENALMTPEITHGANHGVVAAVEKHAGKHEKVIVRWGLFHFTNFYADKGNPHDLDELLDRKGRKTIVVATVLDQAEMKTLLENMRQGKIGPDLPDYLWIPDEGVAYDVREWLDTQKTKELLPEKTKQLPPPAAAKGKG